MTSRSNAVVLGCAILALVPDTAARAHAFLRNAVPAVGSTIRQAPADVTLAFSESVEPAFSTITVTDAQGVRVDRGVLRRGVDDNRLAIGLTPLPPGRYVVDWHALSTDTHRTQGRFSFTIVP